LLRLPGARAAPARPAACLQLSARSPSRKAAACRDRTLVLLFVDQLPNAEIPATRSGLKYMAGFALQYYDGSWHDAHWTATATHGGSSEQRVVVFERAKESSHE